MTFIVLLKVDLSSDADLIYGSVCLRLFQMIRPKVDGKTC